MHNVFIFYFFIFNYSSWSLTPDPDLGTREPEYDITKLQMTEFLDMLQRK